MHGILAITPPQTKLITVRTPPSSFPLGVRKGVFQMQTLDQASLVY